MTKSRNKESQHVYSPAERYMQEMAGAGAFQTLGGLTAPLRPSAWRPTPSPEWTMLSEDRAKLRRSRGDRQRGGRRREGLGGERRDRKGKMTARVGIEVGTLPGSRILQQSPEADCQSTKGHTLVSPTYTKACL